MQTEELVSVLVLQQHEPEEMEGQSQSETVDQSEELVYLLVYQHAQAVRWLFCFLIIHTCFYMTQMPPTSSRSRWRA